VLKITIVSPSNASMRSAPGGIGYLAEMYEEAGLVDDLSRDQITDYWLFTSLDKLKRRYPGRILSRWVNPYSLLGLYLSLRFRIRSFPTIIIGDELIKSVGGPSEFEEMVDARLSGG
jgi:hypothetical protein